METIIVLLLVISTLTACAGTAPAVSHSKEEAMLLEEGAVLSEAAPDTLSFQLDMAIYEDTALADDGTELVTCRFEYPVMKACWRDGTPLEEARTDQEEQALAAVETFNSQFGPSVLEEEFQDMTVMAQEDLDFRRESDLEWISGYTLELTSQVYQTENMVSVSANYYSYTGGAHPNTVLMAWNFDLTTGQFFTPEVLATDGQGFSKAVKEMILDQISFTPEEALAEGYWENYQEIVAGWSSYAVSFDKDGMNVGFSPYELAAYVVGAQEFHLSYEQLEPYLSPHGRVLLGLEADDPSTAAK